MSRDSDDFDIDDSSENVLSEWPRVADEPAAEDGDTEGNRDSAASETWSIAAPAPDEQLEAESEPDESELPEPAPDSDPDSDPEITTAIAVAPSLEHAAGELDIPEG